MTDNEPEYRRRIGHKTAENERKSERERDKAAEDAHVDKVITAIKGVTEETVRQGDEDSPKNRSHRRWHKGEVIGLWAAAGVGALAILYAKDDSAKQREEMEAATRPWLEAVPEITKVDAVEWDGKRGINVEVTYHLKGYGNSPARNITHSWRVAPSPGNAHEDLLNGPQKASCNDAESAARRDPIGGHTLFPKAEKDSVVNEGASGFDWTGDVLFSVQGCFDYTYGNDRHGKTGIRLTLGRVKDGQIVGLPFIKGSPQPGYVVPPSLLLTGYPRTPPLIATLPPDSYVVRFNRAGNYAE